MDIVHRTRTQEQSGQGKGLFLLSNKRGGYCLLGDNQFSHFSGVCFLLPDEWTMFKAIDDIRLDAAPTRLVNNFYAVVRESGEAQEEFFMFDKTLYYEVRGYHGGITVDLDMRRVYDDADQGRVYKIYWEDGCVVVEYARQGYEEVFYLVVRGEDSFTLLNSWEPRRYAYDKRRGSRAERWVYRALQFDCSGEQRLSFTFGRRKERAMRAAAAAWHDWELAKSRLGRYAQSLPTDDAVAYSAAMFSLESLVVSLNQEVDRTGVYAGLPWFFHFWSRDELVSLQGLVLAEKYSLVKDILMRYAGSLQDDGRLPNRLPPAGLGSADAVGWLWKRFHDLFVHLESENLLWEYFSYEELSWVLERLERSLRSLREHHFQDGLVVNGPQETWMDTHGGVGDVRAGARVEVQALTLASLRALFFLCRVLKRGNGKEYRAFEKSLVRRTRESFFEDGYLCDGAGDATQRPNVFLAYYAYPGLLSKQEWVSVFDKALERLWLEWGGLASLAKDHPWFADEYAAQEDRSYHRGDSWYWVNNIAALAMHRLGPVHFRYHIDAVRDASIHDLLWGGVLGHCAEVSSARRQGSQGCLSQAWSAATLLELLHELRQSG
ncbi:hypothetical protein GF367_01065 [Candidatus Woesearchaeota archaeon]|nr:hypothetical protein [Candidatus Woesearchaeota archaeon]